MIITSGFMILFYAVNAVVHFRFLQDPASALGVAVFHTTFNAIAVVVMFPFSSVLEKLAYLTIPQTKEELEVRETAKERSSFWTPVSWIRRDLLLSIAEMRLRIWPDMPEKLCFCPWS